MIERGKPKSEHVLVWNVWHTWSASMTAETLREFVKNAYDRYGAEIDWKKRVVRAGGRELFFFKYLF